MESDRKNPRFLKLAMFLGLSHLAHIAIGVTDVAMAGWLGTDKLAAVALAASVFYVIILSSIGFIAGLSPLLAKYEGAGETEKIISTVTIAAYIVLGITIIGVTVLFFGDDLLLILQQPGDLIELTPPYFYFLIPSAIAVNIFCFLWVFASIREQSQAIFWISFLSIFVNAGCNYIFMFGVGNFVGLGIAGLGLSTFISICLKAVTLYIWLKSRNVIGRLAFLNPFHVFTKNATMLVLSYAVPMAILEASTIAFFTVILFIIGLAGADYIAIHAITIQIAEIGIAFALGFSEAAAISIAYAVGEKQYNQIRKLIVKGLFFGAATMTGYAFIIMMFGDVFVPLFTDEELANTEFVMAQAKAVLILAALCLIVDSGRITLIGVLRGLGDTEKPVYYSIFGLWGVAIPLSYLLSIQFNLYNSGIWLALMLG
ncbi:MATE family efflux transporter, partial [Curvivirga aplysinae]|uniref:MATE family efflux transporter n=1 Tax=Curvivirga aplysinae TaxID=2529852 RepID=UPI0012BC133D